MLSFRKEVRTMSKLSKYLIPAGGILMLLMPVLVSAQLPPPTSPIGGTAVSLDEVQSLIEGIARFLIIVSIVIAVIFIIWGGIRWITAGGSEDAIKKAKQTVWNGIIGALIVLAVGVILQTLAGIVARTFFGSFN